MKRKSSFIDIRIDGELVPFSFQVSKIVYRDKKGKLAKFRKGKYLKKEVFLYKRGLNKESGKYEYFEEKSFKYSSKKYVKYKTQPSKEKEERRIGKRLHIRKKSVFQRDYEGRIVFTYFYVPSKAKQKKGSKHGHKAIKKVRVSKNSSVSRKF